MLVNHIPSSVVVRAGEAPGPLLIWLVTESPLEARGVGGASGGKPSAEGCSRWDSTANLLSFLEEEVVCSS